MLSIYRTPYALATTQRPTDRLANAPADGDGKSTSRGAPTFLDLVGDKAKTMVPMPPIWDDTPRVDLTIGKAPAAPDGDSGPTDQIIEAAASKFVMTMESMPPEEDTGGGDQPVQSADGL